MAQGRETQGTGHAARGASFLVLYGAALLVTLLGLPRVAEALQPMDRWLLQKVEAKAGIQPGVPHVNRY